MAIPRKQKCHCGPGAEAVEDEVKSETPTAEPPLSPTRPIYRVQKNGSGPRQNGNRKLSFDPVNLDRVDPRSINILNQYRNLEAKSLSITSSDLPAQVQVPAGFRPGFAPPPPLPTNGFDNVNNVGYGAPSHYGVPELHQMAQSPVVTTGKSEIETRPSQPQASSSAQSPTSPASGSGRTPRTSSFPYAVAPKTHEPAPRSCCCGPKDDSPEIRTPPMAPQHVAQSNGAFIPPFPPPQMAMKHQQYGLPYPQPGIFTYPANYGSWSHPVNQAMWTRMQHLQPNTVSYPNVPNVVPVTTNGSGPVLGTSHECNCGPGCQCVGCLAHPFNHEMLQYVGGAWDYDIDVSQTEGYGSNVGSNGNSNGISNGSSNGNPGANTSARGQGQPQKPEPGSPAQAPTPSDASVCSDDQALSTSDYFFVNLPLFPGADAEGDSCGGNQALCPCGDDCQCDGCVVHNTRPLDHFGPP